MRLVLIRHGKSDWNTGADDFNRPLNKRGLRDAPRMAEALREKGITPDRIITSPALRALTTARLMADVLGIEELEEISPLYLASPSDILDTARTRLKEGETLFLFGHNPGISYAASVLRGTATPMPTCAAAIFDLVMDGGDLVTTASDYLIPKALP
jgi:phosphohistidine phosphatase